MNLNSQKGFTLLEILIAVVVLGIVTTMLAPTIKFILMAKKNAYIEKEKVNNNLVAAGLLNFVIEESDDGTLPSVYTGESYSAAACDPSDTDVLDQISKMGISEDHINNDGTISQRERVYKITDETQTAPLYGSVGPEVNLDYQIGVLYMSECPRTDASCDPEVETGDDRNDNFGATTVRFSTEATQRKRMQQTVAMLNTLQEHFVDYFRSMQQAAAAGSTVNYYPDPASLGGSGLTAANPFSNEGCHHDWLSLTFEYTNGTIPEIVGLSADIVGQTPWGGDIEYCRDYEPDAVDASNADIAPHYAAFRFHEDITDGNAPDGTSDIVIGF
ncbi:MAG: type II secretion system protein [Desulfobacteraceae bacterium]|nr:type II secretion system protein [Desulfobacteraceae bacterium]